MQFELIFCIIISAQRKISLLFINSFYVFQKKYENNETIINSNDKISHFQKICGENVK